MEICILLTPAASPGLRRLCRSVVGATPAAIFSLCLTDSLQPRGYWWQILPRPPHGLPLPLILPCSLGEPEIELFHWNLEQGLTRARDTEGQGGAGCASGRASWEHRRIYHPTKRSHACNQDETLFSKGGKSFRKW